ncbi:hypothetical protein M1P56_09940 [Streptomyces sp. HU2014]|uniref:hypothetical protein n=1 Tax=Streptomyces sp. HU2014 TaxID=2939414 RepID=UPI00200E6F45|nr:hypothetical protein [Streptomyces sp. HU2014]UQI44646.1 hypothetical protein M1P56_09940 [Streptomyces sp. HU2014]
MAKLPSDAELAKMFHLGVTDQSLAAQFDVTVAAVNKRFVKMGLRKKPIALRVNELVKGIWDVKSSRSGPSHHNAYAVKNLKIYMRRQLGDQVSETQQREADWLIQRLLRDGTVVDYDGASEAGWTYVPRRPSDGRRILRWPEGRELPADEDLRKAMELPEGALEAGPAAPPSDP